MSERNFLCCDTFTKNGKLWKLEYTNFAGYKFECEGNTKNECIIKRRNWELSLDWDENEKFYNTYDDCWKYEYRLNDKRIFVRSFHRKLEPKNFMSYILEQRNSWIYEEKQTEKKIENFMFRSKGKFSREDVENYRLYENNPWDQITEIHKIFNYTILKREVEERSVKNVRWIAAIDGKIENIIFYSHDSALAYCIAYSYEGCNSKAGFYFMKMLEKNHE